MTDNAIFSEMALEKCFRASQDFKCIEEMALSTMLENGFIET